MLNDVYGVGEHYIYLLYPKRFHNDRGSLHWLRCFNLITSNIRIDLLK